MIAVLRTDLICSISCLLNQLSYAIYVLRDVAYWHQLLVDTLDLAEQIWKLVCQIFYCSERKQIIDVKKEQENKMQKYGITTQLSEKQWTG